MEDVEATDGCDYCRAADGKPSVEELTTEINKQLAHRGQAQVETSDQSVLKLEPVVHLVTAAYAKNEDGMTAGLSIALIVNQDGSVDLPRDHFLNTELLDYFDKITQSIGSLLSAVCHQTCMVIIWWRARWKFRRFCCGNWKRYRFDYNKVVLAYLAAIHLLSDKTQTIR